jgi:hypothetical protein
MYYDETQNYAFATTLGELVETIIRIAQEEGRAESDSYEYTAKALVSLSANRTLRAHSYEEFIVTDPIQKG